MANGPGDPSDLSARIVAPELSKILGQPVIVNNKPGAGTLLGVDYVIHQPADGYTIASTALVAPILIPILTKNATVNPAKDLPPFVNVLSGRLVMVTPASAPWKTFQELVTYAKANPGKLNYGSAAATSHLLNEIVLQGAGFTAVYVPFSNSADVLTSLYSSAIQIAIMSEPQTLGSLDRLRILAVTGDKRSPNAPNAPTFNELGFPQVPGSEYTFNLRPETPKPIIDKLYDAVQQVLKKPEIRDQLQKLSADVSPQASPEDLAKRVRTLSEQFAQTAKQIGLEPQ